MTQPRFEPLADDAWLIDLGATADTATNARVHALAARIRAAVRHGKRDLLLSFDAGTVISSQAFLAFLLRAGATLRAEPLGQRDADRALAAAGHAHHDHDPPCFPGPAPCTAWPPNA